MFYQCMAFKRATPGDAMRHAMRLARARAFLCMFSLRLTKLYGQSASVL